MCSQKMVSNHQLPMPPFEWKIKDNDRIMKDGEMSKKNVNNIKQQKNFSNNGKTMK